jgi:polyisoprenoid-binding protein YceI
MSQFTPGIYNIDPVHSTIGFTVRHLVAAKVRGHFTDFSGVLTMGENVESSSVEGTLKASSVTTGNDTRDGHLQSSDFFEVEKFPTWTFKSTKITPKGGDNYELLADVSIKGVTKSVKFDLEFLGAGPSSNPGATVVGFEAKAEIDRRDFGINFEGALENGNLMVSHKINIELAVEAHSA